MKKAFLIISGIILFVSQLTFAQDNAPDFFLGKWNVTVIGTPNGDAKFVLQVENKEGALTAAILGGDGKSQKVDRVETKPNAITV